MPPLQMGKLRLSTAVSACFLDLGAGGSEREGTQPCCRAPVGGWQQRARETEPCPRFPLVRFQLPPQVVNRRPLFKPVTAGGRGWGVFTHWPPGRQRPRGARARVGGRLPGKEEPQPQSGRTAYDRCPKMLHKQWDEMKELHPLPKQMGRWWSEPLRPVVGGLGGGRVHTSCGRSPGVRETRLPGNVSVET